MARKTRNNILLDTPDSNSISTHDLLVIGGGVNGAGIAADAAGRGLDVVLCEKDDLASATSSCSSKLIHGGLRYLEFYEFALVRKSLKERELLTQAAQHIIKPLAFQIPILPLSRNFWLLRAGLFLYDNLARRKLYKGSRAVSYGKDSPLNGSIHKGFEYWDGQVDDARLVVLNALQASRHGAKILTRTECVAMNANEQGWQVSLRDTRSGQEVTKQFKAIVNAAGPWVSELQTRLVADADPEPLRLVKGSHIVVPRLHEGEQAFMLQHHDGRIVFVIPYLGKYSLVGTTEQEFEGDLDEVKISTEEISYLISLVNLYFKKSILHSDVVYTYAGVRPLIDEEELNATKVSREYVLDLDQAPQPLLSVYGGKVTTYRVLAEEAVNKLKPIFPALGSAWTAQARLPGGDFELREELFQEVVSRYAWLGPDLIARWLDSYGTLCLEILGDADGLHDLGVNFGANLYQLEVDYLCQKEWATTADDILWRRSKLGYQFTEKQRTSLANYIEQSLTTT